MMRGWLSNTACLLGGFYLTLRLRHSILFIINSLRAKKEADDR